MSPSLIRIDVFANTHPDSGNSQVFTGSVYIPVRAGMTNEELSRMQFAVSSVRIFTDPVSTTTTAPSAKAETLTKKHRGGRRKGQPTWVESITAALGKKALGTAAILKNMEAAGVEINVDNPKRYIGHLLSVHSKGRGAPFARVRGERGVYRVR